MPWRQEITNGNILKMQSWSQYNCYLWEGGWQCAKIIFVLVTMQKALQGSFPHSHLWKSPMFWEYKLAGWLIDTFLTQWQKYQQSIFFQNIPSLTLVKNCCTFHKCVKYTRDQIWRESVQIWLRIVLNNSFVTFLMFEWHWKRSQVRGEKIPITLLAPNTFKPSPLSTNF